MGYYDTLTKEQKSNIGIITNEAKKRGVTNPHAIAGMLAIISKESSFIPKQEKPYSSTSNDRIRKVFGSRVPTSDSALNTLKADPKSFFDAVYGSRNGNKSDEGYKYRGRGLNQITFQGNYKKFADLSGVDILTNPDKMLDINTASKVAVEFAKNGIDKMAKNGSLTHYNAQDINDFKNSTDATLAMYHANAGGGSPNSRKGVAYIKGLAKSDPYGGMTRALARAGSLYDYAKSVVGKAVKGGVEYIKKNKIKTVIITSLLLVTGYILLRTLKT